MAQNAPSFNSPPNSKVEWALHFASLGYGVFPLHYTFPGGSCSCGSKPDAEGKLFIPGTIKKKCNPGKHPATMNGVNDATTDESQIRQWFKNDPAMNYGVTLGTLGAIIDIDQKADKDGLVAILKHLNDFKARPRPITKELLLTLTFTVQSANGGWHLYFATKEAFGNSSKLSGVDVRAHGAYVVGPGCEIHRADGSVGMYTVVNPKPMFSAPDSILALLGQPVKRDPNADVSRFPDQIDSEPAIAMTRHLLRYRKPAVEDHGGNLHTYVTAERIRDHNISEDMCFELMTEEGGWNERCEPEWGHEELKGVIANAYSYAKRPMGNVIPLMDYFDDAHFILPKDFLDIPKEAPKVKRRRFLPMSHDEQDNIPQEKYIVEGLIAEKNIAWFYGPTGTYKTYGIIAMLLALAAGHEEWCGFPLATDGGKRKWKVIFVSGEGGMSLVTERKKAWLQKHGLTSTDVEFYPIIGNMPNLLKGKDVDEFLDDITSPESPWHHS